MKPLTDLLDGDDTDFLTVEDVARVVEAREESRLEEFECGDGGMTVVLAFTVEDHHFRLRLRPDGIREFIRVEGDDSEDVLYAEGFDG